jgi:hypothetical protein
MGGSDQNWTRRKEKRIRLSSVRGDLEVLQNYGAEELSQVRGRGRLRPRGGPWRLGPRTTLRASPRAHYPINRRACL